MHKATKKKWIKLIDLCMNQRDYFHSMPDCPLCPDPPNCDDCIVKLWIHGPSESCFLGNKIFMAPCVRVAHRDMHALCKSYREPRNVRMHLRRLRKWVEAQ